MINDETPLLQKSTGGSEQLTSLFQPLPAQEQLLDDDKINKNNTLISPGPKGKQQQPKQQNLFRLFLCDRRLSLRDVVSTLIGSFTFLLYHVVFCLAQASAITRPHSRVPIIGPMAKMSALGIFLGSTVFVFFLGDDIPAIYPTSDLFLAPFWSNLAVTIDDVLYQDGLESNTLLFLSTFTAVSSSALFLSGCLCVLAARVRLANLGAFLPYSVLCGFFTAIGILMWTLAFSVDTGGLQPAQVFLSGNTTLVQQALVHHAPSLAVGITMHLLGPLNPFLVIFLVLGTIVASYLLMMLTGTSLIQAQNNGWFWSATDLVLSANSNCTTTTSLPSSTFLAHWVPPQPFGLYHSFFLGQVYWRAFKSCLPTVLSLAFLYLIRCSLHAAALKKNIPNVTRPKTQEDDEDNKQSDIENGSSKKRPPLTLQKTLECGYAYSQLVAALSGGLGVAPAVAASLTLFKLGAEAKAPQFGSFFLIFFFYLTDFRLVQFIPKPAFSCLLVLAFLDMTANWLVMSYRKIRNKAEWAVAPLIVVLTFAVGMLNAIFLGVAFSTFIFVASFYRTGVVKYLANGLTLRSSTERGVRETKWLNQNGDLLQIVVLQNYLFFGNAQSLLSYVSTMFEEPVEERSKGERTQSATAPKPLYLVMDCTIVTGMDTSAVDLMREIAVLCTANNCSLYLVGLSRDLRRTLEFGGVDASRSLSYQPDLESALSKAEDRLLKHVLHIEELDVQQATSRRRARTLSNVEDGFMYALSRIDEQHGFHYSEKLSPLQEHTKIVELQPGESLFLEDDGVAKERGFFFIEHGLLKVEKDALSTLHRQRDGLSSTFNTSSIGHLNARTAPIGLTSAHAGRSAMFRLARVGQGWVVGTVEGLSGSRHPGIHTAVTPCRLHLLPFHTIPEIEESNPSLVLSLFRLLSHLAARQQELTIEQLAQFVAIGIAPRG